MDESGNLSEDDEFEISGDHKMAKEYKGATAQANKPWDEAYEVSQDLSVAESVDMKDRNPRERMLKNDKFDEAIEVSQSLDQSSAMPVAKPVQRPLQEESKSQAPNRDVKTQKLVQGPYDEAVDFDQSGSDESYDTIAEQQRKSSQSASRSDSNKPQSLKPASISSAPLASSNSIKQTVSQTQASLAKQAPAIQMSKVEAKDEESSSDEEEGEHDESYEHVEGAYQAKDYAHLNVSSDVRELFQYIERYKAVEVELPTTLKCFIPEYIPSIGEMDAFVKVPRPDNKDDDLGLKVLDEPSAAQSDPTVLELQLRAQSKKLQYGDVVVRSIEQAAKNPALIEKWIQNISDLHRSKPPQQVHYRRNMPDTDTLMEAWSPEFEAILDRLPLPSPDLDLSLLEYSKVLCNILDIPVYENPIESLHLMFTLFTDFRNNPHFQSRATGNVDIAALEVGGADVLEVNADFK